MDLHGANSEKINTEIRGNGGNHDTNYQNTKPAPWPDWPSDQLSQLLQAEFIRSIGRFHTPESQVGIYIFGSSDRACPVLGKDDCKK